jgi:nucleoside-diphosphate-sugar epimerase
MNILVTGGSGFIGTTVIEKLSGKNHNIKCVSKDLLNSKELEKLNVEIINNDLNNGIDWETILPDTDIIYHIAGITRAKNNKEFYDGNYRATQNLIDACLNHCNRLKRFVYISSLSAVGPSLDDQPVNEETVYHPVSEYGKSKMLAELEVLRVREKIPVTIIRPSAVYGPREKDMYMYMKSIKRGVQLLIGYNQKYLNLIYVDDLAEGIISASMHKSAEDQIYFLGSEASYRNEEIGEAIARVIKKRIINIHLPHWAVFTVCGIEEVAGKFLRKNVFLNLQKAKELIQTKWTCSIEKAQRDLDFKTEISLFEGFMKTYQWYLNKGWL